MNVTANGITVKVESEEDIINLTQMKSSDLKRPHIQKCYGCNIPTSDVIIAEDNKPYCLKCYDYLAMVND